MREQERKEEEDERTGKGRERGGGEVERTEKGRG